MMTFKKCSINGRLYGKYSINQPSLLGISSPLLGISRDSTIFPEFAQAKALNSGNLKGQYHAIFSNTLKIVKTLFG